MQTKRKWARGWEACRECGTIEVQHWGKGLCKRCYQRTGSYRAKEAARRDTEHYRETTRRKRARFYENNREPWKARMREYMSRRRAESGEPLYRRPPEYWRNRHELIYDRGEGCAVCGCKENLEAHHIIPESKGGSHDIDNLQILCVTHHRKRGGVHSVQHV